MSWCLLLLMGFLGDQPEGLLVITSKQTPLETISRRQLRQIWLEKLDRLNGTRITPVQLKQDSPLRARFEEFVFRKNFDVGEYWLEQGLTGGGKPPLVVSNEAILMLYVSRNPGFVGYVSDRRRNELERLNLRVIDVTP